MKTHLTPNSSNIKRIGHDGADLFVEMLGGSYRYIGVPEAHFAAMRLAESAGKYLNAEIKSKFTFEKLAAFPGEASSDSLEQVQPAVAPTRPPRRPIPNGVEIVGPALAQGSEYAAGYDLVTTVGFILNDGERFTAPTGVKISMPPHMMAWVTPRSGLAAKRGVTVLNAPGLIDPDYTGEIGVVMINLSGEPQVFHPGDRIAQLVFQTVVRPVFIPVDTLTPTERGEGGFGSSGVSKVES